MCMAVQAQPRQVVDGIVAVVGKTIVRHSDIEQAYTQVRLHQGMQNAKVERCKLLENMLVSKLLVHKGMIDSVEVSEDQVEREVQRYLANQEDKPGSSAMADAMAKWLEANKKK